MDCEVFQGLVVIEFTNAAMGPITGKYFADYGATVIRVESLQHLDMTRVSPPYKAGAQRVNASGLFVQYNTGKLSVGLDLQSARGREIADRLVSRADVVIENFAPGVMARLGLSYEEMVKLNPDLIMISLSNMGVGGPYGKHPGLGGQLQAMSGLVHLLGQLDRPPNQPFGAISDMSVPSLAVCVLTAALDYRRRTGKGQYFELSQFEASLGMLAPLFLDRVANGREAEPMGNRDPDAAPHGAYPCEGDDSWCAIAVFSEEEWVGFCRATGKADLISDTRFKTFRARKEHEDELDAIVSEWTCTRTSKEVMSILQQAGVPAGMVNNPAELLEDPQLQHRHYFHLVEHPEMGPHSVTGQACILSSTPAVVKRSPLLGEHNEAVFKEFLRMSDEEFVDLVLNHVLE